MKVVSSSSVMVLGQSTNDYNGTVYYNCDLYDAESGLYSCGLDADLYNKLQQQPKPVQLKNAVLEIQRPYKGASRLQLLGWS